MSAAINGATIDRAASRRPPASLALRCRCIFSATAALFIMAVGSVLMLIVGIVTLFQTRRFQAEVMLKRLSQAAFWIAGVKMIVHDQPRPERQVVYISNHTSTIDVFVLTALGLPNTRFFMSGFLRKNPAMCIMGYLTGTFWTVPQQFPEVRKKIFQRAERVLRRTGESVYLSPEGDRVTTGEIGHFNKGSFHLATKLKAPIVPFYIAIPKEIDPGRGVDVRPGVLHVHFRPAIASDDWREEDVDRNRTQVRDYFVRLHVELKLA